jgi:sugar phosphate isomerase/epimerase
MSRPEASEPFGAALVLWEGNVTSRTLDERLEAAQAGRFASLSVAPLTVRRWQEGGTSVSQLREALTRADVRVSAVDPLTKWLPSWDPPANMSAEDLAFGNFETDVVLEMAHSLGAELITAVEYNGRTPEIETAAASFALLCDSALKYGIRIGLEAMPFSGICEIGTAWEIVRLAGAPNGGLVVDSWHVFRGPAPQRDLDTIRSVPADKIFALQLDDAPNDAEPDLRAETMHRRLLPGSGALDLTAFLEALRGKSDASRLVGPEVFSDTLSRLPAEELGRVLRAATDPFLQLLLPR